MLKVNLKGSDEKIAQLIKDQCAKHGKVVSVKFRRSPKPFAIVSMATPAQTLEMASEFGGSAHRNSALIHLKQKPWYAKT